MNLTPVSSSISTINLQNDIKKLEDNKSFGDMLNSAVSDVNKEQIEAYDAMKNIASGKVHNLQKAVQQIEEAELSLKLALEVKNKTVSGFKQITQMQI